MNVMEVSDAERDGLRNGFIALNTKEKFRFPGAERTSHLWEGLALV